MDVYETESCLFGTGILEGKLIKLGTNLKTLHFDLACTFNANKAAAAADIEILINDLKKKLALYFLQKYFQKKYTNYLAWRLIK